MIKIYWPVKIASAFALIFSLTPAVAAAPVAQEAFIGTVYNLFHEEYATDDAFFAQVDKDIAAIKAAHITHILIFPMSQWNPDTQALAWKRTDYLVRKIESAHLKFVPLMLKEQQSSHYFPIWAYKTTGLWDDHHLAGTNRNTREDVDFDDPRVYPYVESYFKAVAERYGKSPALAFYNIWNEPHYSHQNARVESEFRDWLKQKYGDLAALRRSWGEDYSSWDQVSPFVNDDWNSSMPWIDWVMFHNEHMGQLLGKLKATLLKYDNRHPVNANPVNSSWTSFSEFDQFFTDNWAFTANNDINGLSYYPDVWDRANPNKEHPLWQHNFTFNTVRSASGAKDFILTEMYTNAKTGLTLAGYLDADEINRTAWAAFANDAKGIIFWKWEPFLRGRQSLGRGLVQLDGQLAPRGEAVKAMAEVVAQNAQTLYTAKPKAAEVAILFDMVGLLKNLEEPTEKRTQTMTYESNAGLFKALDEANIGVDMLRTDMGITAAQLRNYKIVFLPFQLVMRPAVAALLKDYVSNGGHLVADARSATLDEFDLAYRQSPGGLVDVFAAERQNWIASPNFYPVQKNDGDLLFEGRFFREKLRTQKTAQVLARFENGDPALVQNHYGKGRATLVATTLGAAYYSRSDTKANQLILRLTHDAGVDAPAHTLKQSPVSLRVHQNLKQRVIYALNSSDQAIDDEILVETSGLSPTTLKDLTQQKTLSFVSRAERQIAFKLKLPPKGVGVFVLE